MQGKRIIVVGAGSGIGKGIALAAQEAGAEVVLVGRSREKLDAVIAGLPSGAGAQVIAADVQDKLIAPHEPFEARVAHFAGKIMSSAQNLERCLRLHAGGFVDKVLQLFEVRLKQALFLRRPSVLCPIVFEHLGQILIVNHCLAIEFSLCP